MNPVSFTWRDRLQILNSFLFCIVGIALIVRYFMIAAPRITIVLGAAFFAFGIYRLVLVRREIQKRAGSRV
jgi:uncharacterized membrane protein HdeD (DUF308 family)